MPLVLTSVSVRENLDKCFWRLYALFIPALDCDLCCAHYNNRRIGIRWPVLWTWCEERVLQQYQLPLRFQPYAMFQWEDKKGQKGIFIFLLYLLPSCFPSYLSKMCRSSEYVTWLIPERRNESKPQAINAIRNFTNSWNKTWLNETESKNIFFPWEEKIKCPFKARLI